MFFILSILLFLYASEHTSLCDKSTSWTTSSQPWREVFTFVKRYLHNRDETSSQLWRGCSERTFIPIGYVIYRYKQPYVALIIICFVNLVEKGNALISSSQYISVGRWSIYIDWPIKHICSKMRIQHFNLINKKHVL